MPLTAQQARLWQAMNIGPLWVRRDGVDPLAAPAPVAELPEVSPMKTAVPRASAASAPTSSARRPLPAPTPTTARVPARAPARPVRAPQAEPVEADPALVEKVRTADWKTVAELIKNCHACPMAASRTMTVPGEGAPGCPLVIVGEAPGRDEDLQGMPFVGKSGKLLTRILAASGIERATDAAVVNVLKCRPPANRDPHPEEMRACAAFLDRQLELLEPRAMLLMGRHAVLRILGKTESIGRLRGQTFEATVAGKTVPCIVTYHPSYLLRTPAAKEKFWHDVLAVRALFRGSRESQAC